MILHIKGTSFLSGSFIFACNTDPHPPRIHHLLLQDSRRAAQAACRCQPGRSAINCTSILSLKTSGVPTPSIEEQQVVVWNIKTLDAKIRLNIGIIKPLGNNAQAIFNRGLSDSHPAKAKIAAKANGRRLAARRDDRHQRQTRRRTRLPWPPTGSPPPPPPHCFRMGWRTPEPGQQGSEGVARSRTLMRDCAIPIGKIEVRPSAGHLNLRFRR